MSSAGGPLVVVFSSWSDAPEQALARALADAAGVEPGELVDVATRAQADRDVYLILDQAEEYFTYHGEGDGFDAALAGWWTGPLRVNVLLSLREDTLAALDRLKGAIPNLFGNVLRLDHLDRAAGRAAILKPLERWRELEGERVDDRGRARRRRPRRRRHGPDRAWTGWSRRGRAGTVRPRDRGAVPPARDAAALGRRAAQGSATLRAETLGGLGGAAQVVADHLERAIEALDAEQRDIAAQLFDHLVTPSGTKIAHEASDLAEFAGGSEAAVKAVLGVLAEHRIIRTDEAGGGRSSTTFSPAQCSAGRRARGGTGTCSARTRRPGGGTVGSPSWRSARSCARARQRSPRSPSPSGARRATRPELRRAANWSRAPCRWRQRSGAGDRARSRGCSDRAESEGRGGSARSP